MWVIQLYREAWKKDEHKTPRQRQRDVVVSILAPLAVLYAMVHTFWMYWKEGDTRLHPIVFFILLGGVLSYRIFVHACRILINKEIAHEEDEKNQPVRNVTMLAFAAWLFPMGLFFTIAEMYDDLWMPIGPLELDQRTGRIRSGEFSSPWGDALLAFSAFCMLVEEFSLVHLYDDVKQKFGEAKREFQTILSLSDNARNELDKIINLRDDTEEESKQVEELHKKTKECSTKIEDMYVKTRKMYTDMKVKKARNRFLVVLKWCSVAGGIVLLLCVLIKLKKLDEAIDPRIGESAVGTGSGPEGFDRESESRSTR